MRQSSRNNKEIRSCQVALNVAKNVTKSCSVSLGKTKIQINYNEKTKFEFQINGNLTNWEKLIINNLQNYLRDDCNLIGAFEVFVLSNDGSLGTAVITGLKELGLNQALDNVRALTLAWLDDEPILDLDYEEENEVERELFIVQEIEGQVKCLAIKGSYPPKILHDSLVIAEGIVNTLQEVKEVSGEMTVNKEIVIATNNAGKAREFALMFGEFGYKVKTLKDFPDIPEIIENGQTFTENAMIKAETLSKRLNLPVLGDDSGLCVDALKGLPGIYSARFAKDHDDAANNAKLLSELAGVPELERTAHFHTSLVMAAPGKENLVVEGEVEGLIATIPTGDNGFGYDPLFYLPELNKTMAELKPEEKNKISHRAVAMAKLAKVWQDWLEGE